MDLVEYTEFIVKSICKEPDLVTVKSFTEDDITTLEVMVPEKEFGSIIGKGGNVARSIRIMVQAFAYLHKSGKVRVNLNEF